MIEIRRATDFDASALAALGERTFVETFAKDNRKEDMDEYVANTFGVEKQRAEIRDPNRWIEIAWSGSRPAGYIHLIKSDPAPCVREANPLEILRLYVDSRWHGKGVGAALIEKSLELARAEGFQTLWLGVWERNLKAQAFYRKFGFSIVGSHIFRLGADDQTDLVMMRKI